MIKTIEYKGDTYPAFQSEGNAMKFAMPLAREVCVGHGIDIGCNRLEWAFVDRNEKRAIMCDPAISSYCEALKLPDGKFDYIISSHSIEHYPDWVDAIDYWRTKLVHTGVLFLYLPDYSQKYWRPWNNRKHTHYFTPQVIKDYLMDRGWDNIFVSGVDLNNSFIAMAQNGVEKWHEK